MTTAARIVPVRGERPLEPPQGFRKQIPDRIKFAVLIRQKGLDPDDGEPLDPIREGIAFDHRPALHQRTWNPEAEDTIPPASDPEHIIARRRHVHLKVTGRDATEAARLRDVRAAEDAHRQAMDAKQCGSKRQPRGTIRGRPFPKKHREAR